MSELEKAVDEAVVKAELGREIAADKVADAKDKAQAAVDNALNTVKDKFEGLKQKVEEVEAEITGEK